MTNSRRKGKRGELEACEVLRSLGIEARRGRQYQGGDESPDLVTSLQGIHVEVTVRGKANPILTTDGYRKLLQASKDCGEQSPLVLFREIDRSGRKRLREWLVLVRAEDLVEIARAVTGAVAAHESADG